MQQQAPSLRISTLDAMLRPWGELPTSAKDCGKLERKAWNSDLFRFLILCCKLHGPVVCLAHSLQKRKWSHHFKLAAANDITCTQCYRLGD